MADIKKLKHKKIGIFNLSEFGDLLCLVPALTSLKAALPKTTLVLIGNPNAQRFVSQYKHLISSHIIFPGYPGLTESYDTQKYASFLKKIAKQKLDLVVQMNDNGVISNSLIQFFDAKHTAGFYSQEGFNPNSELFTLYKKNISATERHEKLLKHLGVTPVKIIIELPQNKVDKTSTQRILTKHSLTKKEYVIIHIKNASKEDTQVLQRYSKVADSIMKKGERVVLLGEKKVQREIQTSMTYTPVEISEKIYKNSYIEIVRNAKFVISNTTSLTNIADTLHVPSLTINHTNQFNQLNREKSKYNQIINLKDIHSTRTILSKTKSYIGQEENIEGS